MKKILVIDNYDSFTYNLVHIIRELGHEKALRVVRNDQFDLEEVEDFDHILLSPGPGIPRNAGLMPQVIERYGATKNMLGVCLGHQAIGEAYGARLLNLDQVFHGMVTPVELIASDELFFGLPHTFKVCRYHSWVIEKQSIPEDLLITSIAENGTIMSLKHKEYNVRGVQFHPESIMTEHGKQMIENWLAL